MSIPIHRRLRRSATAMVVPQPQKGRGGDRRAAPTKRIEDHIALVTARRDDALQKGDRLLCGIAETLLSHIVDGGDTPNVRHFLLLFPHSLAGCRNHQRGELPLV